MKRLFVLLGLLVLAVGVYSFMPGKDKECPAEGKPNPKKGKDAVLKPREKNANRHKNRQSVPQTGDYDKTVSIEKMYDSKDDSLWSEDKAATIIGYFFRAVSNNMESCNCYTEDKSKYSTNIYLSPTQPDKNTRLADCIVVVAMPYSRTLSKGWSADTLNDKMAGKKLIVSGWLMYDVLHSTGSIMTNSNGSQPERRTIWGICPITALSVTDK
ncbi:MAG TPA: hypothetical protein VK890_01795 [Bacteroidia bacterium]|jgi:hypothetical protein|nr:hypothetical protein [Bacteroidia bacterium]